MYSLIVLPKPATPGLITLDESGPFIIFAASSNPADANTYTIVFDASNECQTTTSADHAHYTYEKEVTDICYKDCSIVDDTSYN